MQTQIPNHTPQSVQMPANPRQEERMWAFSEPPAHLVDRHLQLLTIGGISVPGLWCGQPGEFFVAWSPMNLGH